MDLLISLGVNSTLAYQMVIFLVAYVVLKYVLFTPYFNAFAERNTRTVGQTELAEKYINETKQLEERFATSAKAVNEKFRAVFDKTRAEAGKEYERVITEARAKAKKINDESRAQIATQMNAVRPQLLQEQAGISQLINQKLIGKEASK